MSAARALFALAALQQKVFVRSADATTETIVCEVNAVEPRFRAAQEALFARNLLPPGSLVDSGSNFGGESCWLAKLFPTRRVHAVDPGRGPQHKMKLKYGPISNIHPLYAALGNPPAGGPLPEWKPPSGVCAGPCPRLRGIDELGNSSWLGEQFGFLHLDVEGGEIAVLKGAAVTIHREYARTRFEPYCLLSSR